MISKVYGISLLGIDGHIITIETDYRDGTSSFFMVGMPDVAVRESKERVFSAIRNTGFNQPFGRFIINLAPADMKKEGSLFDLPISISIMMSANLIKCKEKLEDYILIGELSLDGNLKGVKGVLPMVASAVKKGHRNFIVPSENAYEASLIGEGNIYGANSLYDVVEHLCSDNKMKKFDETDSLYYAQQITYDIDLSDVKGQQSVKRAMEIAAAGAHNMLMIGPPGCGKTMLAKRFPTIMPDMTREESLEVSKIYSVSGLLQSDAPLITQRPFRSPHHTVSTTALVGGGRIPVPGEVSLSHGGVLFLDEFVEFQKMSLEVLRQPLEDKSVTVSRLGATITYPSSFMLIASMNPCPCGYYNDPEHQCHCSQNSIERYLQKISGPIIDRIDIISQVNVENYEKLNSSSDTSETSKTIKKRIEGARKIQLERFKGTNTFFNSSLSSKGIDRYCALDKESDELMKSAFHCYNMSARSYHRILKLARTIADLEGSENLELHHLSEALQYRGLDKKYFK